MFVCVWMGFPWFQNSQEFLKGLLVGLHVPFESLRVDFEPAGTSRRLVNRVVLMLVSCSELLLRTLWHSQMPRRHAGYTSNIYPFVRTCLNTNAKDKRKNVVPICMLVYGQDPLETSPVPKTVAATPCFDVEDDEEPNKFNFKKYVSGMCAAICVEVSFSTQTVSELTQCL